MGYLINLVKGDRKAVDNYLTYKQLQLDMLLKNKNIFLHFLKRQHTFKIEGTNTQDTKKNVERIKNQLHELKICLKKLISYLKGSLKIHLNLL